MSGVVQRFIENMTRETGYSFYVVGGGLDARYMGGLQVFEYMILYMKGTNTNAIIRVESTASINTEPYTKWTDTERIMQSYVKWNKAVIRECINAEYI